MSSSIHGHQVLHFMLERESGYASAEALVAAIQERFGAEARFHTCSAGSMDAAALVAFLESRGKFAPLAAGGFSAAADRICAHE